MPYEQMLVLVQLQWENFSLSTAQAVAGAQI